VTVTVDTLVGEGPTQTVEVAVTVPVLREEGRVMRKGGGRKTVEAYP
jgi:hypothetical protein